MIIKNRLKGDKLRKESCIQETVGVLDYDY